MFLALYIGAQTLVADLRGKLSREDGAVATEYALLLVLIALAIIAAAIALGSRSPTCSVGGRHPGGVTGPRCP